MRLPKDLFQRGSTARTYLLFPSIIAAAVEIERIEGISQPTEFVFDSDQRFERLAYEMVPDLMPLQSFKGGIVNVSYRDDRQFLPLQAADLLAWQKSGEGSREQTNLSGSTSTLPDCARQWNPTPSSSPEIS